MVSDHSGSALTAAAIESRRGLMELIRTLRWMFVVAAGFLLIAVAIRFVPDVAPEGDFAVIDIHVINAIRTLEPVGAYSRFGWNHPGPTYSHLLAPLYWLSGYRHLAILVTVTLINVAALVALLALVRRSASRAGLFACVVAVFTVYLARAWGLVGSPWNPDTPILPLALLIACGGAAASGDFRWLPAVIGLASLVIQAHVGLSLSALAIVAATLITAAGRVLVSDAWHCERRLPATLGRSLRWSIVVGAVLWALPVIDAIRPGGLHNVQHLYQFFGQQRPVATRVTDRAFAHYFVAPFGPRLTLPTGGVLDPVGDAARTVAEVQALLLFACAVWWIVRRRRFESSLAIVTLAASAAAWASIRRIPEQPQDHTVYWVSVLGVWTWALIATAIVEPIASRLVRAPHTRDVMSRWTLRAAIAAVVIVGAIQTAEWRQFFVRQTDRIQRAADLVRAHLEAEHETTPIIHIAEGRWGTPTGVALQLYRGSIRPHVDADWVSMFGEPFRPTGKERVTLYFAEYDETAEDLRHRPDYKFLGSAENTYVYAVVAPPPSRPLAQPLHVIDSSIGTAPGAPALVDGIEKREVATTTPADASFVGAEAFVTIDVPATPIVGVRLWGQPLTEWILRCATNGTDFRRMGRVRLSPSATTSSGDSYTTELAGCRQLKIAPAEDGQIWWLSEIQLLVPSSPGTGG
jgi:hypothetical protein